MDTLMKIALIILIPIVCVLAIAGTAVVAALFLNLFFGVKFPGM